MADNYTLATEQEERDQTGSSASDTDTVAAQAAGGDAPSSTLRRMFLKRVSALSMGAVAAPAMFHATRAEAAALIGAPEIPSSNTSQPVIEANQNTWSHLLTIDFRSQSNLDALNLQYGSGTVVKTGNVVFDPDRGVCAADSTSGLDIRLDRMLDSTTRSNLAARGQLTIEVETKAISDPWLVDQYTNRYNIIRTAPLSFPNSSGDYPSSSRRNFVRLLSSSGLGAPTIRGPMPEAQGLNTHANNLAIRMNEASAQNLMVGLHSAMHDEFTSVTTSWWGKTNFTAFVDRVPFLLAGPAASGAFNVGVKEFYYSMNDVGGDNGTRDILRLFFSSDNVFIRRITLGAARAYFPVHPLFEVWASYGDSFTHRGGYSNSRFPVSDFWDSDLTYYFVRRLAAANYRAGYGWNNSLGGGGYRRASSRTMWNNGGNADLGSLMALNPTFVMMAASHNDAGYIGYGATPGSSVYQQRLAEIKADVLEHVQVILTGTSPNWYKSTMPSRAKIAFITTPPSPHAYGWERPQIQAQLDLNRFVMEEIKDWVTANLGASYASRIATYDAAALFGNYGLVDYHPLFTLDGTGVHPNWWGSNLISEGWWRCAVDLIG